LLGVPIKWHRIGALLKIFVFAPQFNPAPLDITMSLYSLFTKILSEDEEFPESGPTDDDTIIFHPYCTIL